MGMFDYIRCDVPLPDGYKGELQTKDLECDLTSYLINGEKRLVALSYHDNYGAKHDLSCEDATDLNYHGILRFYGVGPDDDWHEYNAKFTDGVSVEIVLIRRGVE